MVSTLDFESNDPSSSLGRSFHFYTFQQLLGFVSGGIFYGALSGLLEYYGEQITYGMTIAGIL